MTPEGVGGHLKGLEDISGGSGAPQGADGHLKGLLDISRVWRMSQGVGGHLKEFESSCGCPVGALGCSVTSWEHPCVLWTCLGVLYGFMRTPMDAP